MKDPIESQIEDDFANWCHSARPLGRDRLKGAFRIGWRYGYAMAVGDRDENPPLSKARIEHRQRATREYRP